ncbi:enoyl-CoA hydratase/isomerase family protein [Piscinibacter sp.]|uniref:enoyl-CoA hydratase/isomerase family protein n=1 Tax=Piscinibacter sp. TaxID=1903157 RepID=UPI002DFCB5B4|nr:enoyl-CoA hydratase/isomerase family protein [Burkholderiaceae bacterium]
MTLADIRTEHFGSVAVLTLDHPPVNSLSHPVRLALWAALEAADADDGVQAIVLAGAGRGFCGGGDLNELRSPLQQAWPGISNHLLPRIEACRKPVIAAMHGFAVGGGLELALACHHRVAKRDTQLALPEMKHGVLPPSGSQRLPRAVGVDRALALIVLGGKWPAEAFADTALIDRLCDDAVVPAAVDFACALERNAPPQCALLRHLPISRADGEASLAAWRERLAAMPQASAAMHRCVDAVEFAVSAQSFDSGLAAAKRLHDQLAGLAMNDAAPTGNPS